ncbi:insulin receptor substrate 1-like [Diaphorina citri]|uniref:Insulin receptor substrate 1-like n=1 Tax=Diaphorina citri TaxID=121845 RepID=A0A3Q0IN93_DIACI|nr:insulin receptor substrate 1-like [Diaphorina citri]
MICLSVRRSIVLSTCFHINRRTDSKHKHAIALYTKRDVFCLVLDSASDLEDWLQNLLFLQHGQDLAPGEVLRPNYGKCH